MDKHISFSARIAVGMAGQYLIYKMFQADQLIVASLVFWTACCAYYIIGRLEE